MIVIKKPSKRFRGNSDDDTFHRDTTCQLRGLSRHVFKYDSEVVLAHVQIVMEGHIQRKTTLNMESSIT